LQTFSATFNSRPECDESPFINTVLAQNSLIPHHIQADRLSPLADFDRILWHVDEPCLTPGMYMHWALLRSAQKQDVRVLLTGTDGDNTVSHGYAYLTELAGAGKWAAFAAETNALAEVLNLSAPDIARKWGFRHLIKLARERKWITYARDTRELSRYFDVPRWSLFRQHGLKPLIPGSLLRVLGRHTQPVSNVDPIINADFARRIGFDTRVRALQEIQLALPQTARDYHYKGLTAGISTNVFEVFDKRTAAFSIEARHPFYDKRLVEFCLALPGEQKLHQGWNRMIMRRAMAGILPPEVQWRSDKTDIGSNFRRGLLNLERKVLDEVFVNNPGSIEKYVDIPTLREVYHGFTSQVASAYSGQIWSVVTLALWLRYTGLAS
jgi:asparagine synthase (glutamine-hydrolysing)